MRSSSTHALEASASALTGFRQMVTSYYQLTKPGIIYSNVMTAIAGYLFASHLHIYGVTLLSLLVGTGLLIACACVCNNYLDRTIDTKMARTKKRALVTGVIPGRSALIFATLLGVAGFFALLATNWLTVIIGLVAVFSYVVLYGLAKRRSIHGTLIGTLPGAASLVAGYTTISGRLDIATLLLFLIMVAWQMAHFYAIAVRRLDDYAAADIPVWPVCKGVLSTTRQMVMYEILFIGAVCSLWVCGYTGFIFALVMSGLAFYWLYLTFRGFGAPDRSWAKRVFLFSLVIILALSVMLPLGLKLP